ncbi:MAG: hypothetical protein EZS28_055385, partial [Streblomastix strix]
RYNDQEQRTNEKRKIIADGSEGNENEDQSEHTIESKRFNNGNDSLIKNDSGMQLQITANGESNPKINVTKSSSNTKHHNVNGSDEIEGNGCRMQLQEATNENRHENNQTIDNSVNINDNEQANDSRIGGQQQNNQRSNNEIQHKQDSLNNKSEEIRSPHIHDKESEWEMKKDTPFSKSN